MKWRTVALISLGVGSAAETIWHMLIGEIGIPLGCCVLLATCVAMLMLRFPLRAAMATVAMWIALCLVAGVTPVGLTVDVGLVGGDGIPACGRRRHMCDACDGRLADDVRRHRAADT